MCQSLVWWWQCYPELGEYLYPYLLWYDQWREHRSDSVVLHTGSYLSIQVHIGLCRRRKRWRYSRDGSGTSSVYVSSICIMGLRTDRKFEGNLEPTLQLLWKRPHFPRRSLWIWHNTNYWTRLASLLGSLIPCHYSSFFHPPWKQILHQETSSMYSALRTHHRTFSIQPDYECTPILLTHYTALVRVPFQLSHYMKRCWKVYQVCLPQLFSLRSRCGQC